jgi:hypothetical protein
VHARERDVHAWERGVHARARGIKEETMSDIVEIPVSVTLWRLSKRGNRWLDTGNLLNAVTATGRGECYAKGRRVARSLGSGGLAVLCQERPRPLQRQSDR